MPTADRDDAGPTIGERIYALRVGREPRLTQAGLAERAGVSVGLVSKLEQGVRLSAQLESLEKIAHGLGVPVSALFSEARTRPAIPTTPTTSTITSPPMLASAADVAPADADFVAELRESSQRIVALETMHGGTDVLALAVRSFRAAHDRLARGAFVPQVEHDLEAAAGEAGEVAAWIAFDAERQDLSRQLIHEALLLSRSAGDRSMELFELGHMAMQSVHLLRPREGLRLADDVLDGTRLTPRVKAVFRLRQARALAQKGDRPRALAAIDAAANGISSSIRSSDPHWTWWVDDAELCWHRGMAMAELGRLTDAVSTFSRQVSLMPEGHGRRAYMGRVHLLDVLVRVGDWREAEALLPDVAARAAEVNSGRASAILLRVTERIAQARGPSSTLLDHASALRRSLDG